MKFVVSVVNDAKQGTVDNNHIFCMYQASDCLPNMRKVFGPYTLQLKAIQSSEFRIDVRKSKSYSLGLIISPMLCMVMGDQHQHTHHLRILLR